MVVLQFIVRYEDKRLYDINRPMIVNLHKIPSHKWKMDPTWGVNFAKWITYRSSKYKKWGFKGTHMVPFIKWLPQFFNKPIWIWPIRTDAQIIESQVKKLGFTEENAVNGVKAYHRLISNHIKDNLFKIDLTNKRSEKSIAKELRKVINGR